MVKIIIDKETFKVLASDTRLDILKILDNKKLNLNDMCRETKLNKATLHEHLVKLHEAGLIKRHERQGHKWVYYNLSWKGSSLLHPENSRIVVMFSATIFAFIASAAGLIAIIKEYFSSSQVRNMLEAPNAIDNNTPLIGKGYLPSENHTAMYLFIFSTLLTIILFAISIWRYKKNKTQKL